MDAVKPGDLADTHEPDLAKAYGTPEGRQIVLFSDEDELSDVYGRWYKADRLAGALNLVEPE